MSFGGFYGGGGGGVGGDSRMVMADGSFNSMPLLRAPISQPQLIASSLYNSESLSLALVCILLNRVGFRCGPVCVIFFLIGLVFCVLLAKI